MSTPEPAAVRAAGVVLLRDSPDGTEVALIHRPVRQDWSLPKGKVDPGEHIVATAVRECDEETGIVPVLGVPLPQQSYLVSGRPKTVDYWAARIGQDEGFAPDDEVDEVRWWPLDDGIARLTYPRDGDLVRMAAELPPSSPLILLRHTQALKRSDFAGDVDADRPLTGKGRTQAKTLVPLLGAFGIEDVFSSDALRCRETIKRFAKSVDASVHPEHSLSEEGYREHPKRTVKTMQRLVCHRAPLVVCSHRPVLPALVEVIAGLSIVGPLDLDPRLSPGGFLVVHRTFTDAREPTILAIERHVL